MAHSFVAHNKRNMRNAMNLFRDKKERGEAFIFSSWRMRTSRAR